MEMTKFVDIYSSGVCVCVDGDGNRDSKRVSEIFVKAKYKFLI